MAIPRRALPGLACVLCAVTTLASAQTLRPASGSPPGSPSRSALFVGPPAPEVLGQDDVTQAGDRLGIALDLTAGGVMVGAHHADGSAANQGAVDLFRRVHPGGGSMSWTRGGMVSSIDGRFLADVDTLLALDAAHLGRALAVQDGLAVLGVPGATLDDADWPNDTQAPDGTDTMIDPLAGGVIVLEHFGSGWGMQSVITLPETEINPAHDIFRDRAWWRLGASVAVSGTTIAVGAPHAAVRQGGAPLPESGAVVILRKDSTGWVARHVLTGLDLDPNIWPWGPRSLDYFGTSLALDKDLLAVGVPNAEPGDEPIASDRGVVHLFQRSHGTWTHVDTVFPDMPFSAYWRTAGWYGAAIDLADTTLIVGQPGYLHLGNTPAPDVGRGMAWIVEPDHLGDWSVVSPLEPPLPPPDPDWSLLSEGDGYGTSVGVSFCRAVVGAPGGDWSSTTGSVYLWERAGTGNWLIDREATPTTAVSGDQWGRSVAIDDLWLAAGGWLADDAGEVDSGAVMVLPVACDCNGNGLDDDLEIAACAGDPDTWSCPADGGVNFQATCADCDGNGVIDACELCADTTGTLDCNGNGLLDACEIAPPGTTRWSANDHHYMVVVDPLDFEDAALTAQGWGSSAQLASPASFYEAAFISNMLGFDVPDDGTAWLGGVRTDTSGSADQGWTWLTDDPWLDDQTWWEDGQPDQPGESTGLMATSSASGLWRWSDDSTTGTFADAYVVEFDADCNDNGRLDECELLDDPTLDCDGNGRIDACTIADHAGAGIDLDCDGSGTLDSCDLAADPTLDCNGNGVMDACDIAHGASVDCDGNGIPDECVGASLVINEVHVDPAPTLAGDANGDGIRHALEDQFVELINISAGDLNLASWTIDVDGATVHTFAPFTTLESGCAMVVFGGGTPMGFFGGANVVTASGGALDLGITGGSLSVFDDTGALVATTTWSVEAASDQSLVRDPDRCGDWALHMVASPTAARWSPGTRLDDVGFCLTDDDGDGIDDAIDNCDLYNPDQADCGPGGAPNGIGDTCDIDDHIAGGGAQEDLDCDYDGGLDECQIAADPTLDCDGDGQLDLCQIVSSGFTLDCNADGILDTCQIADGTEVDCNFNGIPDWCDINVYGTSQDIDGDGVPDECSGTADPCDLNFDGIVNSSDLLVIISDFGCIEPPDCMGDFDGDGDTDTDDLLAFLTAGCI